MIIWQKCPMHDDHMAHLSYYTTVKVHNCYIATIDWILVPKVGRKSPVPCLQKLEKVLFALMGILAPHL